MKIVGWAILYKGIIYDFATSKDELFRMWVIEPTPLYVLDAPKELVIPTLTESQNCH